MNPQEYKESREKLYDKAHGLYQMATKGSTEAERDAFKTKYDDFMLKNELDQSIVLNIEKFKELKPHKTFKFDGMEFVSFEEFKNWFELNKDTIGFFKRIRLLSKLK